MGSEFSEMLYSVVFVNPSLGAAVIAVLLENCNCVAVEEDPILYIQSKVHVIDAEKRSGDEDAIETDDVRTVRDARGKIPFHLVNITHDMIRRHLYLYTN